MIQKMQRDTQWKVCLLLSSALVARFLSLRQQLLLHSDISFWRYYMHIYVCVYRYVYVYVVSLFSTMRVIKEHYSDLAF